MTEEYRKIIREAVALAGKDLEGKLPPHPRLKKRNPYAHLWERIQARMGRSYKDCEDWEAEKILDLIEYYRNNPC